MTGKITKFPGKKSGSKLRNWEGFEYIKFTKDKNGISYRAEHLRDYSQGNKYAVTIMRTLGEQTVLYDYYVKNSELEKFFKCCFDGKIEGEIIEITKCAPENLA
jgi:hypothetical protein